MTVNFHPALKLKQRILIVDDEPYNLMGLKTILEIADPSHGIRDYIDEASNGLDAFKAVKKAH